MAAAAAPPTSNYGSIMPKAREAGPEPVSMRLGGFEPPTVGLEVRCSSAELQAPANRVSRLVDIQIGRRGRHARLRLTNAGRETPSKVVMAAKRPDFRRLEAAGLSATSGRRSRRSRS